jgi:hypothetical protein
MGRAGGRAPASCLAVLCDGKRDTAISTRMGAWRDSVTGVQPQQELAGRGTRSGASRRPPSHYPSSSIVSRRHAPGAGGTSRSAQAARRPAGRTVPRSPRGAFRVTTVPPPWAWGRIASIRARDAARARAGAAETNRRGAGAHANVTRGGW